MEWKKFQCDPQVEHGVRDKISEDFLYLIQTSFAKGHSVAYETNYQTNFNLQLLKKAESLGYKTRLIFLLLDSHKIAIDRVTKRELKGGHFVDNDTIKSRFVKGLTYLDKSFDWYGKTYIIDVSHPLVRVLTNQYQLFLVLYLFFEDAISIKMLKYQHINYRFFLQ